MIIYHKFELSSAYIYADLKNEQDGKLQWAGHTTFSLSTVLFNAQGLKGMFTI